MRDFDEANPANVLTTTWLLDDTDVAAVEERYGHGALRTPVVTISKGYSNSRSWSIEVDQEALVRHLVEQRTELSESQRSRALSQKSIPDLQKTLHALGATRSQVEQSLLDEIEGLSNDYPKPDLRKLLDAHLPKIMYFPTYEKLDGIISLDNLSEKISGEQPLTTGEQVFLALLDLARTSIDELREANQAERLIAELEAVSNSVSDEIFEYWSQNRHLQVEMRIDQALPADPAPFNKGSIFRIRIRNTRHRVTVGFDERSAGFVWFFSFLVWFSQMKKRHGDQLLILLDEPGLNLHAKAQSDLLRFMRERLEPSYQVLYTTHSPFMIDSTRLDAIRTVEDVERDGTLLGTKVSEDVLSTDQDTLFPLRAALGYDITQTLFVGEHTLVVEGPSDLLYLRWASRELQLRSRNGLDPRWTITPAGGIDKISSFVALFGGNNLHVATLADFHSGDKAKVQRLRESDLLRSGHVFSADQFAHQDEADVEDILGRELYIDVVHAAYAVSDADHLPTPKPDEAPVRVEEEVRAHLRVAPSNADFDHYTPAAYLLEHADAFRDHPSIDVALNQFQELFDALNALL